eukprot:jgi/Tetstr1/458071/TSEL_044578.t1
MLKAVQHALRSVHAQRHEFTATVLILLEWIDASYKKAHLLNHPYMQKLCELPADLTKFRSPDQHTETAPNKDLGTKWPVGVYLVAFAPYLANVNATEASTKMSAALRVLYPGRTPHFHLNTNQ